MSLHTVELVTFLKERFDTIVEDEAFPGEKASIKIKISLAQGGGSILLRFGEGRETSELNAQRS
jgi:hypothetical protein